jgi:hypothetical protein
VPTGDSTVIQIDTTRADVGRPHNIVWVRYTYPSERTLTTGQGRTFIAQQTLERRKVNCGQRASGWIEQSASDAAGNNTFHVVIPEQMVFLQSVEPDSYEELVLRAVCAESAATTR